MGKNTQALLDAALTGALLMAGLLVGTALTTHFIRAETEAETVTLPPIEVTVPGCEWGGPYPTFHDSLEQWIVICAKGEGDG